ncbi:superoxide dismutase family protein [Paenibacillus humicola]|uniref:superoxide dismutase family protein n=1 Tax=Paenibacillus humicola TaxID=3110540 RepID=UPI00237C4AA3|nr:superoxide dismutase family protein [Paenibacillus humicola]
MRTFAAITCAGALSLLLAGSALAAPQAAASEPGAAPVSASLIDTKGASVGTAVITQLGDTVRLHVEAKNLPPGVHGIHFHETGVCTAPSFESAGAHLNPQMKQHGFNNPKGFHAGDLPNITVKPDGTVTADIETRVVTLEKGLPNSLLKPGGTALVIHEKADDYVTDPSGNSGSRIACGAIR